MYNFLIDFDDKDKIIKLTVWKGDLPKVEFNAVDFKKYSRRGANLNFVFINKIKRAYDQTISQGV